MTEAHPAQGADSYGENPWWAELEALRQRDPRHPIFREPDLEHSPQAYFAELRVRYPETLKRLED